MATLTRIVICTVLGLFIIFTKDAKAADHSLRLSTTPLSEFVLPFQLFKNLIVVKAYADGQQGSFIIDTGASSTILNATYFTGLINRDQQSTDFAGSFTTFREKVIQFNWGHGQTTSVRAMITNFDALKKLFGVDIMGYIGYDILQDYEIVFDYQRREITLFELNNKGWRKYDSPIHADATDSITLGRNDYLPYLTLEVGGKKLKLGIDSGAAFNLLRTGLTKKIDRHFQKDGFVKIAGYSGKVALCQKGILQKMNLNNIPWAPMNCVIQDIDHINTTLDTQLDGLLGFEFLKQYKVAINYRKNRLYIWQPDEFSPDYPETKLLLTESQNPISKSNLILLPDSKN
ncbi:MAG: hypothetical protein DHS20C18_27580 [Saprospiraceae bacterium]|nr:MAG: hypothetical protein DHS20C18_27580 [Saprospiraceae bacterium]